MRKPCVCKCNGKPRHKIGEKIQCTPAHGGVRARLRRPPLRGVAVPAPAQRAGPPQVPVLLAPLAHVGRVLHPGRLAARPRRSAPCSDRWSGGLVGWAGLVPAPSRSRSAGEVAHKPQRLQLGISLFEFDKDESKLIGWLERQQLQPSRICPAEQAAGCARAATRRRRRDRRGVGGSLRRSRLHSIDGKAPIKKPTWSRTSRSRKRTDHRALLS